MALAGDPDADTDSDPAPEPEPDCCLCQASLGLHVVEDPDRGTIQVAGVSPTGENSTLIEIGDEVEALDGLSLAEDLNITAYEDFVGAFKV